MSAVIGTVYLGSVSLASVASGHAGDAVRAVLVTTVVATGLLVLALALPGHLGLGDVAFVAVLELSLGWLGLRAALYGLLATLMLAALHAVIVMIQRGTRCGLRLPLGPALLLGWLLAVLLTPL